MTLDGVSGYFINLDRSVERKKAIEADLQRLGLLDRYRRFDASAFDRAVTAQHAVPSFSTPSLTGNWRSHLEIMRCHGDAKALLHVCEDDIRLSQGFAAHFEAIRWPEVWDIVFFDLFVPNRRSVFKIFRSALKHYLLHREYSMLDLDQTGYNGGMSSYIVNPASIDKLLRLLDFEDASKHGIAQIDRYVSQLIAQRRIKAYAVVPFLTSLNVHHGDSTLHEYPNPTLMQGLYTLRKSFAVDEVTSLAAIDNAFLELPAEAEQAPAVAVPSPFRQEALFASPLQLFVVPEAASINADLLEDVRRWCQNGNDGYRSSFGGKRSKIEVFDDPSPAVQRLLPYVQNAITHYLQTHLAQMLKVEPGMDFDIDVVSWAYLLEPGDFMRPHLHPDGFISGVYYIKVPGGSQNDEGAIVFQAPDTGRSLVLHPTTVVDAMTFHPQEGSLVLFPSYLPHYVNPFRSGERAVIAFDVTLQLKGALPS